MCNKDVLTKIVIELGNIYELNEDSSGNEDIRTALEELIAYVESENS